MPQDGQLVTQHSDLEGLSGLAKGRAEEAKEPADEQEGDRTAHAERLVIAA